MVGEPLEEPLTPSFSNRINHVVAFTPQADQLGDQLGRVLQVAVHDDNGSTAGVLESGTHRRLVTEVAAQADNHRLLVLFVDRVKEGGRCIAAAVVNQQHFKLGTEVFENRTDSIPERSDAFLLVIKRNHHGEHGPSAVEAGPGQMRCGQHVAVRGMSVFSQSVVRVL